MRVVLSVLQKFSDNYLRSRSVYKFAVHFVSNATRYAIQSSFIKINNCIVITHEMLALHL